MSRIKCWCTESVCGPNNSARKRMTGKQKWAIIDKISKKYILKQKVHVRVQLIQQGWEWLAKKKEQTLAKNI